MRELKGSGPKTDVMYRDMTVPQVDHFHLINLDKKQECIPVGCVPPAAVADGGGVSTRHPPDQPLPPDQALQEQTHHPRAGPPRPGTPQTRPSPEQAPLPLGADTLPGPGPPPDQGPPGPGNVPPVDRHTPVNILPRPKLRSRAVITLFPKFFQSEKKGRDKTFTVGLYLDVGIPSFSLIFQ